MGQWSKCLSCVNHGRKCQMELAQKENDDCNLYHRIEENMKYFLDVDNKYYGICHGISTLEVDIYELIELLKEMNGKLNINTLMIQKSGNKFYVKVDKQTELFYNNIK